VYGRSWCSQFCKAERSSVLEHFAKQGNPFHVDESIARRDGTPTFVLSDLLSGGVSEESTQVFDLLRTYCGSNDPNITGMVPKCVNNGVLKWVSRLLIIMEKLPCIIEDAYKVYSNVFDLYATTVFRICAGNSGSERLLLGMDPPSKHSIHEAPTRPQGRAASPLFGFGRRSSSHNLNSKPSRPALTIAANLEAELCAPVPDEMDGLLHLRDMIQKAQATLKTIVKLDLVDGWVSDPVPSEGDDVVTFACKSARVLEKRQAASWSCVFVAAALHLAILIANKHIEDGNTNDSARAQLEPLEAYASSFLKATPTLVSLSNRIACVRSLRAKRVVQEVSCPSPVSRSFAVFVSLTLVSSAFSTLDCIAWKRLGRSEAPRAPQRLCRLAD
jgi:hypothetical protein